jgi:hypothetical protein
VPHLFKRNFSKETLLKRVGHISQLGGVQLFEQCSGLARGVQQLEFRTGTGLIFKVAVDRGMDIGYCEYQGRSLAWIPPSQLPAPWFFGEQTDFGWLRNALGGLINTCGLVHIGNPTDVRVDHFNFPARAFERFGVHDRVALSPARLVKYGEHWQGDVCWLEAVGEVTQAQPFGENLRLTRRIKAKLGESELSVVDEVENLGFYSTQHMLLYHTNFGFPFVQEGSEIVLPVKDGSIARVLAGTTEDASKDWRSVISPTKAWELQVFEHSLESRPDGTTSTGILRRNPEGEYCEGVYLDFNVNQLPVFLQTRMMGEGFYSIILEPATNGLGDKAIEDLGERVRLQPGEIREYSLNIGILSDIESCKDFMDQQDEILRS